MIDLSIAALHTAFLDGTLTPRGLLAELQHRIATVAKMDPAIWISLTPSDRLDEYLTALEQASPDTHPLYGVPFAIKDNIDLAGVPTTAACPDFAYTPDEHATVVRLLIEAGAIPLGKTNLDQFATGLVGVRSPFGIPKNPFNADFITGGSSSGSAVAVARDLVTFALGTDTAGSGRVPAGLNGLVGLKPSLGLLSNKGVVPACRSLDCVSIFARSPQDAAAVMAVAAKPDARDAFSRPLGATPWFSPRDFVFAVPQSEQLRWFGNTEAEALFHASIKRLTACGGTMRTIDFAPFFEAARLLYEGPWVAERYAAIEEILVRSPESLHPVTRGIISGGAALSAVDAFRAGYRLRELKQAADAVFRDQGIDVLVTPTAGTAFRIDEVLAEPVARNSELGYYTNFMNLLDLSACAIPAGMLSASGVPWGITLAAPAFAEKALLDLGALFLHDALESACTPPSDWIEVAVCGAHLRGLPLNHQLTNRGARFLAEDLTSADYKLFALPATERIPQRPGLIRVPDGTGASIKLERWVVPAQHFGSFVASIPAPLGFGKIRLGGGTEVSGFLCESEMPPGSLEITHLGGWRDYLTGRVEGGGLSNREEN
jgi:allophanate hydrolase